MTSTTPTSPMTMPTSPTPLTATLDTPAGPFTVVATDAGEVLAAGFTTDLDALLAPVHPALRWTTEPRRRADLGPVTHAVLSYLDGDPTAMDKIPVRQHSDGSFLEHAWQRLRDLPPGEPVTYTAFAALAGRPAAVRAAAQACARNAAALFVPCHRVIRTDGTLGGYRWGLDVKAWLLAHETRVRNA